MLDEQNGRTPTRSTLAMAVLKGGLAFGAVWMVTLIAVGGYFLFEWA